MGFARAPFTRLEGDSDRPGEFAEEPRGRGIVTGSDLRQEGWVAVEKRT